MPTRSFYGDCTSATSANQLRLWFAAIAYVLICALRRIGLAETVFADATCGTLRLKLLKIGALVRVCVGRIKIAMASACPAAADQGRAARPPGCRRQGSCRARLTRCRRDAPTARHHPPPTVTRKNPNHHPVPSAPRSRADHADRQSQIPPGPTDQ